MLVTVGDLLGIRELGLELAAGKAGLDSSLRCVHSSELADPTPWLSGGELLLTTGMSLKGAPGVQRDYVDRLAEAGVAGLGFGVGFGFEVTPPALVEHADVLGFPVLQVPYPTPFIAISEAVTSRLTEARVREAQSSAELHDRLTALVSEGAGPADVLDEICSLTGGWAVLFGVSGEVIASSDVPPGIDVTEMWETLPSGIVAADGPTASSDAGPTGTRLAVPVTASSVREGVLVFGRHRHLDPRDRTMVAHGATVLGLLLAFRRSLIRAERRVAGDVLSEAFAGRLAGTELMRRLEVVGFPAGDQLAVLIIEPPPTTGSDGPDDELEWAIDRILQARVARVRTTQFEGSVAALVPAEGIADTPRALLDELDALPMENTGTGGRIRIGVGGAVLPEAVRRSYLGALFTLKAAPEGGRIASPADLGAYRFLLAGQPEAVLQEFVASVLGPLLDPSAKRAVELIGSVQAFVEAGGRWEHGAEKLGIHRHTLRYRVQQAEEILGKDLASPHCQLEILLALKARDILEA
jgi:purine catabolism regulator